MDTAPLAGRAPGRGARAVTATVVRTLAMLAASVVVALGILSSSAYGLLALDPYRFLPEATVLAARGQDVGSVLVAAGLVALALPRTLKPARLLLWLGLLATS